MEDIDGPLSCGYSPVADAPRDACHSPVDRSVPLAPRRSRVPVRSAVTRFVVDAPTLLHVLDTGMPVAPEHQLVAPQLVRSQALALLFEAVRRGERTEADALRLLDAIAGLRMRLLGDRVSRRVAWQIAREHALDFTADAEYLAVTRLQVDLFVSVDPVARARAEGVVPVGDVEQLTRS